MGTPIRVLVAPDKFKGTLSADAAAGAMAEGIRRAAAQLGVDVEIDLCPVADGGEGTAQVLARAWGAGAWHQADVTGPCAEVVVARWFAARDGRAVFDSASACGLASVHAQRRDPTRCSTRGVGELISNALAHGGVNELLIGLGGSATVDGGIGMAAALGWRFEDSSGREIASPVGDDLLRIARAVPPPNGGPLAALLRGVRLRVLCDVSTGLIGDDGCAALFGPQKGATTAQVRQLDAGLRHLVALTAIAPGARDGAAGGLAYGLRAFVGSVAGAASVTLESGADVVLDGVSFDARAMNADIVLTGEGRFDATSMEGKAVGGVIARSRRFQKHVIVVPGSVDAAHPKPIRDRLLITPCQGQGIPTNADEAAGRVREAAAASTLRWLRP